MSAFPIAPSSGGFPFSASQVLCADDDVTNSGGKEPRLRVQVHGGAWDIPSPLRAAHARGVARARDRALELFKQGRAPLDIVADVLALLEDDPVFDAGFGSFLNEEGGVELDAAVMEGASLQAGAVAGLPAFAHPGRIALDVLRHTEHVLLVGDGAARFARSRGHAQLTPDALVHPREREAHARWLEAGRPSAKVYFASPEAHSHAGPEPDRRGTVGVVIGVDPTGQGDFQLFAGTSTGGTPGKMVGRVGDVPLVGCGVYADDAGAAVSCTGWGEGLIRVGAAKAVSEAVAGGVPVQEAVERVLRTMLGRLGGRGGIIALDARGRQGAAYTTPDMAYAGPFCRPIA